MALLRHVAIFLAVLAAPTLAIKVEAASSLSFDLEAAKNRPVTKVVTLLKDMTKQLIKEGEEDQEIYDSMVCWCTTNDKDKTKSIDDAEARIADLTTKIEELTALSATLNTDIETLKKEIAANKAALEKAKGIREKEIAEFMAEEKDMLSSIAAMGDAITVLSKNHEGLLLQVSEGENLMHKVASTLEHEMRKHSSLLEGVLTPASKKRVLAFIQQPENFFPSALDNYMHRTPSHMLSLSKVQSYGQQAPSAGSYAPQSGQILGILKQMKEEFETNLAESQKSEQANQKAYEELKASKEEEVAAGEEMLDKKTEELANTDAQLAQSKQDIEDTTASMDADTKYLGNLKEKCQMIDKEFEERLKTRQLEIEAVSKAMAVLNSDDAMDTFSRTFSFVEKQGVTHSKRREQASKLLANLAKKNGNPRLGALAVQVRLDAFTKVKKAIDDMIAELMKQQEEEIKHKDFCVESFNQNEKLTNDNERQKKDLIVVIEDLTTKIDGLTKAIATLKTEIGELQTEMKRASEDREKENREFQMTVADQRATQKLLGQALGVLQGFYGKEKAMLQTQQADDAEPVGPPPPPGFKAYKKAGGAGGVMGLIQQIIEDAKAMEAEAIAGEEDQLKAYEQLVKDTNASVDEKVKDITVKSEEKAVAEADKTAAQEDKADVELELEKLADEAADLHKACDFVLKNFDIRQTARMEEIEALKQAKAILSGSKFSEFLQLPR